MSKDDRHPDDIQALGVFALDNNDIWVAPHMGALVA